MIAKCNRINQKSSKNGGIFYVNDMEGCGNVTTWERLVVGITYEFDIEEMNGYKNGRNMSPTSTSIPNDISPTSDIMERIAVALEQLNVNMVEIIQRLA